MTIELLQRGPEVYIPVLIISLVITVAAYCAVPLILAATRRKLITKTKYRVICYAVNFAIMILFAVGNGGASNGAPYVLWTSIFAAVGIRIMENRGVLGEYKTVYAHGPTYVENQTVPAGGWRCSCGRVNAAYVSTCSCGINKRNLQAAGNGDAPIREESVSNQILFCRKCGDKLLENSRFCRKCGTSIEREG